MEILKRNGQAEPYQWEKIEHAVRLAFLSVGQEPDKDTLRDLTEAVEARIQKLVQEGETLHVELVQDQVEKTLTERNYYEVLKSYILYREERSRKRKARQNIAAYFAETEADREEIDRTLKAVQSEYPDTPYDLEHLLIKFTSFFKQSMNGKERLRILTQAAVELTTQEAPKWEFNYELLRQSKVSDRGGTVWELYTGPLLQGRAALLRNLYTGRAELSAELFRS